MEKLYYIASARSAAQRKEMDRLTKANICIFCEPHLSKKKNKVEYYNGAWSVAKNDFPYEGSSVCMLLIAARHVTHIDQLTPDEWGKLGDAITWINQRYNIQGATLVMRYGNMSWNGSSIQHLHGHIVTGAKHDPNDPSQEALKTRVGIKTKK